MNWQAYGSLVVLFLILYMVFVPNAAMREKRAQAAKLKKRREANGIAQPRTFSSIQVTGITARRDQSTIALTTMGADDIIEFEGISKGNYSETVYVVVDGQGNLKKHHTEVLAQGSYRKGDWGILAVTMSPGNVTQRSIVPQVIHESNAFKLELSIVVNPK